jgi:CBS domain-containing protein
MSPAYLTAKSYLLSDLIGGRARVDEKYIGKLADIIVTENGKVPEVTHLLISRSFGYKSLMVPWDKIERLYPDGGVMMDLEKIEPYEGEPGEGQICLRDNLLDKKVLDCDDKEIEVVYDIKLVSHQGRLYVTDVDCSRAGFLRRIGLKRLSNLIRSLAASIKDDTIPWTYVQPLPSNIGRFSGNVRLNVLKSKLSEINPIDLADILEALEHEHRIEIFNQLDTEKASDTLEEIEPRVQRELVASLSTHRVAELINDMSPAQAADILAALPANNVDAILEHIDPTEKGKICLLLEKHDDRIIGFATSHYITFPPEALVGDVMNGYREVARNADIVMYIYVTSPSGALIGVVDIKALLQSSPASTLGDIMVANVVKLREEDTVATAIKLFSHYGFRALPIVNERDIIKGVIPFRDVMLAQHLI